MPPLIVVDQRGDQVEAGGLLDDVSIMSNDSKGSETGLRFTEPAGFYPLCLLRKATVSGRTSSGFLPASQDTMDAAGIHIRP